VTRRHAALPWIALGAVYLFWGSTYLGIRVAVVTIPPYLMTGTRYVVAGALLFTFQWLFAQKKPSLPSRSELRRIAVIAVLLLPIGNGLLCVAETRVETGTAALLIATSPMFMVMLGAIAARRLPSIPAVAGLLTGTAGIVALVGKSAAHADAMMAALILVSSFSWALGSVYARGQSEHHPLGASLEMLVGGLVSVAVGLAIGEAAQVHVAAISTASLCAMVWLIVAGAMIGYSAFAYAVRTLPTATVATYGYVNPIVAVILGALLLHEPVTWRLLTGGAAVVVSVILILIGNRRASQELVQE
jgi:drug/metabolite transporter (DMT)-like permease